MTDKPLAGRIALVTGASRGLGAAFALELAKAGAHVVATARTIAGLEALDAKIKAAGGSGTMIPLDMTDADGIVRLAHSIDEKFGRLDILIGNAGILEPIAPLARIGFKEWDAVIAINVTANWQLIRAMDPLLNKAPAARALFLTSGVHHKARANWGAYAASKAALEAMVRCYATESAGGSVRVNLFAPGPTRTRMYLEAFPEIDPLSLPTPEEVATKIVPLCSTECTDSGKYYDYRSEKFLEFRAPA